MNARLSKDDGILVAKASFLTIDNKIIIRRFMNTSLPEIVFTELHGRNAQ